ncbi:hypothetical protein OC844_002662 [Tilletia horrida]|nr:hypothetical protein OC844_002662 [Tilletia horrida]
MAALDAFLGCQADVNSFFSSLAQPTPSQIAFSYLAPPLQHALPAAYNIVKETVDGAGVPDWQAIRTLLEGKGPAEQQAIVLAQLQAYFVSVEARCATRAFASLFPGPTMALATGSAPYSGAPGPSTSATTFGDALHGPVHSMTAALATADATSPRPSTATMAATAAGGGNSALARPMTTTPDMTTTSKAKSGGATKTRSSAQRACTRRVVAPPGSAASSAVPLAPLSVLQSLDNVPRHAAMSSGARANLAANPDNMGGKLLQWRYGGVYRWAKGVVDGVALTMSDIQAEEEASASRADDKLAKAERYAHLRERWSCALCGVLRYERIGRTSNLAKHKH